MVERQKVVLVTGAGASRPYRFPTGEQLTREIIDGLRATASDMAAAVREAVPDCPDLQEFARRLKASQRTSIDAFLQPDCNEHYRAAARAAIAWVLLLHERESCRPDPSLSQDWMAYLFNALLDDARGPADLEHNRVTVITFNFDCCLEHAWRTVIAENFQGLSEAECHRLARVSLPVYHVHGALQDGRLMNNDGDVRIRMFGEREPDAWYLKHFAPNLLFFHDQAAMHRLITSKIRRARVIAFLGFSFQAWNVRRLGLPADLPPPGVGAPVALYASGMGLSEAERRAAAERVLGSSKLSLEFADPGDDCLATLRRFPILL